MKNSGKALLLLFLFGIMGLSQIVNVEGYETVRTTQLSLEQESTNFSLLGGMGAVTSYDYYDLPALSSINLEHQLTNVDITRLQSYSTESTEIIEDSITESGIVSDSIDEYTCSAPFDTSVILELNYTNDIVSEYAVSSDLDIFDADKINIDDSEYLAISKNDMTDFYYSTSYQIMGYGALISGILDDTHDDDTNFIRFEGTLCPAPYGYVTSVRIYTQQLDYTSLDFVIRLNPIYTHSFSVVYTDGSISSYTLTETENTFNLDCSANSKLVNYIYISVSNAPNAQSAYIEIDQIRCNIFNPIFSIFFNLDNYFINDATLISINYRTYGSFSVLQLINGGTIANLAVSESPITNEINSTYNDEISFSITFSNPSSIFYIDFIEMNVIYEQIEMISVSNFNYSINAEQYWQTIEMNLIYSNVSFGVGQLKYKIDSSVLENYDYVSDLVIETQTIDYNITISGLSELAISYFTTTSTSEWVVPSEVSLTINDIEVEDETYNSGSCDLVQYPESLIFAASTSNLIFNFSITSIFSYEFELDIVTKSYLKTTLSLSSDTSITLTQVNYLFESDIKHSYINNVDYATSHTISPGSIVPGGSTIKFEVLLSDEVYLPLTVGSYAEVNETSNYYYQSNNSRISINAPAYPTSLSMTISDMKGYKSEFLSNIQSETQDIDEIFVSSAETSQDPPTSIAFTYGSAGSNEYSYYLDEGNTITHTPSSLVRNTDWDDWVKKKVNAAGTEYDLDSDNNAVITDRSETQHLRTCAIYDNRADHYTRIYKDYSQLTTGYLSFRWYLSDVTKTSFLMLFNAAGTQLVWMKVAGGNLQWYAASSYSTIQAVSTNTLYHMRINFDCSGATDTATIFVNGVEKTTKNFQVSSTEVKRVQFQSDRDSYPYYQYVDSVRFSNTLSEHTETYVPATTLDYELSEIAELETTNDPDTFVSSFLTIKYNSNLENKIDFQVYDNDLTSYQSLASKYYDSLTEFTIDVSDTKYYDVNNVLKLKIIAENYTSFALTIDRMFLDISYSHFIESEFQVNFDSTDNILINFTISTDVTCSINHQLYIYNFYSESYVTIDDSFIELNFSAIYVQAGEIDLKIVTELNPTEFELTIEGSVQIYYFLQGEYNYLQELSIEEIELSINEVDITENTTVFNITQGTTFIFSTQTVCFFNVQIDLSYQIANNYIQMSENLTTNETVNFRYYYKADKNYNRWFTPKVDNLLNYQFYNELDELTTTSDSNNIYFIRSLEIDDIVYADYEFDPEFSVISTTLSNNGTYCKLRISVTSNFGLENVTVIVSDFNSYFESWFNASQDQFSKNIEFFISELETSNTFYLEATTTPPLISFSSFQNSLEFIGEDWTDEIEFEAYLDIPQYSELFRIPDMDWTLDGIFYGSRSYSIVNNTFTCEGFNENTLSAYLHFYTNPILNFSQVQTVNNISIIINSSLDVDCYIVFHIDNLQSYNLDNNDVESLYEVDESDFYYILVHLDPGINTFVYSFTSYSVTNVLIYLIPVVIVVAIIGISLWWRNRKNKKEGTRKTRSKREQEYYVISGQVQLEEVKGKKNKKEVELKRGSQK